ncbi:MULTISPECIES: S-layer homology domain-containing protein [unclassified Paenibacillus]|uniref:S-layer homology domain-containing protein n=1 Tax=unclassified Paenibacillus TaxID=185978 RepID=UPI003635B7E1
MLSNKSMQWLRLATLFPLTVSLFGQSIPTATVYGASNAQMNISSAPSTGKWMTGEYHVHTTQSDDAANSDGVVQSLESVLDNGFEKYGMDWIAISDHLRMSKSDAEGNPVMGGPIPLSEGIIRFQAPKIKQLQQAGKYQDKTIFSGFEWDMPTYEHVGVGILTDNPGSPAALKVSNQFEYLFSDRAASLFDPADVSAWNAKDSKVFKTRDDARTGLKWLETNYPKTSYAILNHPSRKTVYTIADIRDFNNLAPDVVFGFEGMPGNQMEPDRGGLNLSSPKNKTHGGADYMLAKLGGAWDALLGEGRRFWTYSNSDSHFEISGNRQYSSGYWPGQYSKNYTWVNGTDMQAILEGMKSGKSFSVFGDLINALDFNIAGNGNKEEMGGDLHVKEGDSLQLTIRFKSPEKNNNGDNVKLDHVDLISGDVTGKTTPGTDAYNKDTNDSTKVVETFTSSDWKKDEEGYNVITYSLGAASKNRYFRLRGTNLGMNVDGETSNGEPLVDVKTDIADNETRFAEINKRNYNDLWFYSNPIFVSTEPYSDQQAVTDSSAAADLGNTSAITSDIALPQDGLHGATVSWKSSNHLLIADDGKLVFRPKQDTVVNLTATFKRGVVTGSKTFYVTVKGADNSASLQLQGTMKTADGQSYLSGTWTNQNVTASVYASVYSPMVSYVVQLSTDGGQHYVPYENGSSVNVTDEGTHTLLFRATDNLGNEALQPLVVNIDRTSPVISLKGDSTINLPLGTEYIEQGATAADNAGISDSVAVTGMVDKQTRGIYTLHYNVKDLAGNAAVEVVRTVNVFSGNSSGSSSGNGGSSGGVSPSTPSTTNPSSEQRPSLEVTVNAKQGAEGSLKDVAKFKVPADAIPADAKINLVVIPADQVPSEGKLQALSQPVEFTSTTGHIFNKPIEITFNYKADQVIEGHKAAVYYYNEQQQRWIYLGGTVNPDGTITISVKHFTKFAVYDYQPTTFKDLAGHWAAPYTDRLIGMNVIQGLEDKSFRPEDRVTRAQFAKILVEALGLPTTATITDFADDSEIPAWAKAYVTAAVKAGFIQGYEENGAKLFKADKTITRAEMSVMIANALNKAVRKSVDGELNFQDAPSIPAWAGASVNAAVSAGILSGYEDHTFRSSRPASRAEAAVIIYKLLDALDI